MKAVAWCLVDKRWPEKPMRLYFTEGSAKGAKTQLENQTVWNWVEHKAVRVESNTYEVRPLYFGDHE